MNVFYGDNMEGLRTTLRYVVIVKRVISSLRSHTQTEGKRAPCLREISLFATTNLKQLIQTECKWIKAPNISHYMNPIHKKRFEESPRTIKLHLIVANNILQSLKYDAARKLSILGKKKISVTALKSKTRIDISAKNGALL